MIRWDVEVSRRRLKMDCFFGDNGERKDWNF